MATLSREERLARLFDRTHAGIKPGLAYPRELLEALGNPHFRFLCVHVAGTNGKGSVCAMTEAMLRGLGLKTGLYTSPHLMRVNERIRLQGMEIDDDTLHALLDRVEGVEADLSRRPTFFETLTALAFLAFAESGVQIAVIETGMGGRLDATNVVTPLVSVITRVDMDHTAWLGKTLEAIAGEKAGILKPGRPAVFAPQAAEAAHVLRQRAADLGCPVLRSVEHVTLSGRKQDLDGQRVRVSTPEAGYGQVRLPLLGRFQLEALATSVCAVETACRELDLAIDPARIREGVAQVRWPARCEVLQRDPPVLLDVAHNPGGAAALRDTLGELFGKTTQGVFLMSHMRDKDADGFFQALAPRVALCVCTATNGERAAPAEELAACARRRGLKAVALPFASARERFEEETARASFGCVAGSVYLAGAWLGARPDPGEGTGRA